MAFKVHTMPGQTADTGRFSQATASSIRTPGLGGDASRLINGLERLYTDDPEDVHLIVGAGLQRLQDLRAEEQSLLGEQINRSRDGGALDDVDPGKANARLEQVRAEMDGIRSRYTAMGRTQRGRNEISRSLTGYMTQVSGAMYLDNVAKQNAQWTKASQVKLNTLIQSAGSVTEPEQVDDLVALVVSQVAEPEADRFAKSDDERRALKDQYRGMVLDAVMGAYVKRGDYASAKAMEDHIARTYGDLVGGVQGEVSADGRSVATPDGRGSGDASTDTAALGTRGVLYHNMVDGLRQRQSADTLVARMKAGEFGRFGSIDSITASLYARKGRAYEELTRLAERDGVGYDALMTAAYRSQGMNLELQKREADRWFAPVQGVRNSQAELGIPQGVGWENPTKGLTMTSPVTGQTFSTPREYWKHLERYANAGNMAAARAKRMIWDLWHQPERMGDGNGGWEDPEVGARWDRIYRQKMMGRSPVDDQFIDMVHRGVAQGIYPRRAIPELKQLTDRSAQFRDGDYKVSPDTSRAMFAQELESLLKGMDTDQLRGVFGEDLPADGDYSKTSAYRRAVARMSDAHALDGAMGEQQQAMMVFREIDSMVKRYNDALEGGGVMEWLGFRDPATPLEPTERMERLTALMNPGLYYREDGRLKSDAELRTDFFASRNDPQSPVSLGDWETVQRTRDNLGNAKVGYGDYMKAYDETVSGRAASARSARLARERIYGRPKDAKDPVTGRLYVEQAAPVDAAPSVVGSVPQASMPTANAMRGVSSDDASLLYDLIESAFRAATTNPPAVSPREYAIREGIRQALKDMPGREQSALARASTAQERERVRRDYADTRKRLEEALRNFEEERNDGR